MYYLQSQIINDVEKTKNKVGFGRVRQWSITLITRVTKCPEKGKECGNSIRCEALRMSIELIRDATDIYVVNVLV
jgi:hypothetical protein